MSFQQADSTSLMAFNFLTGCMLTLILIAFSRAGLPRKFRLGFIAFLFLFMLWVASGVLQTHMIPMVPILFLTVMAGAIWLAFSQAGDRIIKTFSFAALLGFQCFRLPLELILHKWAEQGTVPPTMTWTGQNFDIVSGILCLISIPFLNRSRALVWGVQAVSFALLLNVLRVVVMSSPFPFSWPLEQPLQLIFHLPYALIVPLFVAPALLGHLLVFRKLLQKM